MRGLKEEVLSETGIDVDKVPSYLRASLYILTGVFPGLAKGLHPGAPCTSEKLEARPREALGLSSHSRSSVGGRRTLDSRNCPTAAIRNHVKTGISTYLSQR